MALLYPMPGLCETDVSVPYRRQGSGTILAVGFDEWAEWTS